MSLNGGEPSFSLFSNKKLHFLYSLTMPFHSFFASCRGRFKKMQETDSSFNLKTHSLADIMASVSSVIKKTYENKSFWVRCELVKVNLHLASGHCYIELADRNNGLMVAQCKGIMWSEQYKLIQKKFISVVGSELDSGMKVLFQCAVNFHPIHGFSLSIVDVEPAFTLGEMARMKNESILRLKQENIFDQNKKLSFPILPKRIAIISVETSRGYQDFISTITNHSKNYAFEFFLYEAALQGENAIITINKALDKIKLRQKDFDVVTLIRGGAGDTGLSCYDEYALAKSIATFPLPIVTGIGHATNETVTEMVAHKNCITPTAAASFFLEKFESLDRLLDNTTELLLIATNNLLKENKDQLSDTLQRFRISTENSIVKNRTTILTELNLLITFSNRGLEDKKQLLEHNINAVITIPGRQLFLSNQNKLNFTTKQLSTLFNLQLEKSKNQLQNQVEVLKTANIHIERNKNDLTLLETKTKLLDPFNTLARGYSITRKNGVAITASSLLKSGDVIETTLADGVIVSKVEKNN